MESKEEQVKILKEFGYKLVYENKTKELWEHPLRLCYINLKGFIYHNMQMTLIIINKTLDKRMEYD